MAGEGGDVSPAAGSASCEAQHIASSRSGAWHEWGTWAHAPPGEGTTAVVSSAIVVSREATAGQVVVEGGGTLEISGTMELTGRCGNGECCGGCLLLGLVLCDVRSAVLCRYRRWVVGTDISIRPTNVVQACAESYSDVCSSADSYRVCSIPSAHLCSGSCPICSAYPHSYCAASIAISHSHCLQRVCASCDWCWKHDQREPQHISTNTTGIRCWPTC